MQQGNPWEDKEVPHSLLLARLVLTEKKTFTFCCWDVSVQVRIIALL